MSVGFISGIYNILVTVLDQNGYGMGQSSDPDNPTKGTILSAYRVTHPVSIAAAQLTDEVAEDKGGQSPRGTRVLGVASLPPIQMVLSDFDMTFDALITKGAVDTSYVSGMTQGGANYMNPNPPQLALIGTMGFQSRDVATYGRNEFLNHTITKCTIRPGTPAGSQSAGTNPNALQYTIYPTLSRKFFNGIPFSVFEDMYYNDQTPFHEVRQLYQLDTAALVKTGTGSATITLPYLPIYSDVDGSTNNWITLNGENAAATSLSTTTGQLVLPAGAADDVWEIIYPTAFESSS